MPSSGSCLALRPTEKVTVILRDEHYQPSPQDDWLLGKIREEWEKWDDLAHFSVDFVSLTFSLLVLLRFGHIWTQVVGLQGG